MGMMTSQLTSLTIGYSTIYYGAGQRKHQSSASLATGDRWIPTQRATNEENVSIWWRHHDLLWDVMHITVEMLLINW